MQNQTIFKCGGSKYISSLIDDAIKDGSRTATVSGRWEIDDAVRIPSDFTLILENCHLSLADGSYTQIFVNENHDTDLGRTVEGTNTGIRIIGRGKAILDGGKYNGLSEKNHSCDGLPPIYKNNLILFTNVDNFHISGLSCRNQRWWATNFIFCRNGYIGDMDFCSSDIGIAPSGEEYHGLMREKYDEVLVKNSDGIDLRIGCQNITIENISGFTEDDTVALTGLYGMTESDFMVDGLSTDICNIEIRNVRSSAFCTIVRMLNQSGVRLHDVTVDGVYDSAMECPHLDHGLYAVRIGDTRLYGTRHSTEDETYNITVRNVVGGGDYVLSLAGRSKDLRLENIRAIGNTQLLLDERIR